VRNWSILRNYKEIRNSTKISVTQGIHLTRGGRVQRSLTCGSRGSPAGPTLQPPMIFLGGDALQEAVEWTPSPRVGGGALDGWPANT
jgi:hypothetical protein